MCFLPEPDDERGMHAPVMRGTYSCIFPPNTRFELQEVIGPREWEAPNGVYPQQRLLVVTATYRAPRAGGKRGRAAAAGVQPQPCCKNIVPEHAAVNES